MSKAFAKVLAYSTNRLNEVNGQKTEIIDVWYSCGNVCTDVDLLGVSATFACASILHCFMAIVSLCQAHIKIHGIAYIDLLVVIVRLIARPAMQPPRPCPSFPLEEHPLPLVHVSSVTV